MADSQNKRSIDDGIVNTNDKERVLKGIQPRHQTAYKIYKFCRYIFFLCIIAALIGFALTFVEATKKFTGLAFYRYGLIVLVIIGILFIVFGMVVKAIFLRKPPFDDKWVLDIANKFLGTELIYYDSKYIYIEYNRTSQEKDKREFVTDMTDKSPNYSYFYIDTNIEQGVIIVECKKRAPIPKTAEFKREDDKCWNIVPLGLCVNTTTQQISPVGWRLNDTENNPELLDLGPAYHVLIAGGTGCFEPNTPIPVYDTLIH